MDEKKLLFSLPLPEGGKYLGSSYFGNTLLLSLQKESEDLKKPLQDSLAAYALDGQSATEMGFEPGTFYQMATNGTNHAIAVEALREKRNLLLVKRDENSLKTVYLDRSLPVLEFA